MPKFIKEYIELCFNCSFDISTVGNMRHLVIPRLQLEAEELRAAVEMIPSVFPCRQVLEDDAEELELAVRSGLQRCTTRPVQHELFAA